MEASGARLHKKQEIRLDNQCFFIPHLPLQKKNVQGASFSCWLNNCHTMNKTGAKGEKTALEQKKRIGRSIFFAPTSLSGGLAGYCSQSFTRIFHKVWLVGFVFTLCYCTHQAWGWCVLGHTFVCLCPCCVRTIWENWLFPANRWLTQFEVELCQERHHFHPCTPTYYVCCLCSAYPWDWTDKVFVLIPQSATCFDKGQPGTKQNGWNLTRLIASVQQISGHWRNSRKMQADRVL